MKLQPFQVGKILIGRLDFGEDLYETVESYCLQNKIHHAWVNALGAVSHLAYFYYDQTKKSYIQTHIDQKLEIVSCMGNISLKEGKPFAHLHLACSDSEGRTVGGHLTPGTKVFACEIIFFLLEGEGELNRVFDTATGLHLWSCGLESK